MQSNSHLKLSAKTQTIIDYGKGYQPPTFESIFKEPNLDPEHQQKFRIALVFTGLMTDHYHRCLTSWQKYFQQPTQAKGHQVDLFLSTWDILDSKEKPITKEVIEQVDKDFRPAVFQIDDYASWKSEVNYQLFEWVNGHQFLQDLNSIRNGVWAQFYRSQRGIQTVLQQSQVPYDLVIRTRFDFQLSPNSPEIPLANLVKRAADNIISLRYWQPRGIENKVITGSPAIMEKYSQVYSYLNQIDEPVMHEIKLSTIYVPEVFFHMEYINRASTPFQVYQSNFDKLKNSVTKFISEPTNLQFYHKIIPERLLYYYLFNHLKLQIHVEEDLFLYEVIR